MLLELCYRHKILTLDGDIALSTSILFCLAPLQNPCGISEVWANIAHALSPQCLEEGTPGVYP